MKKLLTAAALSLVAFFIAFSVSAQTSSYTLQPWIYDPGETNVVISQVDNTGTLTLEKNADTAFEAAAGATIYGTENMSTDGLTLSYDLEGYCGAGSPRFNVQLTDGTTIFLGCLYGNDDDTVSFTAGQTYGGILFPEGKTIERIDIVMDEEGQSVLSNIMINDEVVEVSRKTLQVQCKQNKWKTFATIKFKNQGECVSYFMKSNQKISPTLMPSNMPTDTMSQ